MYYVRRYLSILSLSVQILRRPPGRGNVMSEKFKSFIEQITEKTGLMRNVETAARLFCINVD